MLKQAFCIIVLLSIAATAKAQFTDEMGMTDDATQRMGTFNPNSRDTTSQKKEIPRGLTVWTVDRHFGDIHPAEVDTMPHLFMNTTFNAGMHGEYNTIGNNYSARLNRIVTDRPELSAFFFVQPYDFTMKAPDQLHFTNTLSPITNVSYYSCGDKTNGEDRIDAKFAVNANKRLGLGFDIDYAYARGYFQNQSTSHFGATLYASYRGDRYQMHAVASTYHRKTAENGGITDDSHITHPESFDNTYAEEEIPTVLSTNWNRNNSQHFFLSHRYNIGFYRKVKMTEEELKARSFATAAAKDKKAREDGTATDRKQGPAPLGRGNAPVATGRPTDARIAGDEPTLHLPTDSIGADTTRIKVDSQQKMDSLLAVQGKQDSIDATMKREYVPVTSIIHTLDINNHDRIYQAYATPADYYAATYYDYNDQKGFRGDSIYDQTKYLSIKNTVALALLEGFNKYVKAGLKGFVSYENISYQMPDLQEDADYSYLRKWTGHNLSLGGLLSKTQGKTLHYDLGAEVWLTGLNAGALRLDFSTDLNFPLFGDTVQLAAKAFFHRTTPGIFQTAYHSKHLWWDNGGLGNETRTHVEGLFSYPKTRTKLRVAIEEIQNYTYFGMSYDATTDTRTNLTAGVYQETGNINLMTAQLYQDFRLGPLNWENIITYQNSSNTDVLPVPTLNVFTNLYLKFKIVGQLLVELGADATFFTKYYAPDYCPQLNQFAVQQNADSRIELGGYPFVDVYANMHLKHARFFVMMSHVNAGSGNRMQFLAPHYPQNSSVLRFGVSWNFFN